MDSNIQKRFDNVAKSKTFNNLRQKFYLEGKSVLDIGCTYGEFLKHFGSGSVGLTIIPEEAEVGRESGMDIRVANIEDQNFTLSEKFDFIFANNIYEHMQSPHNFLLRIKKFLKPGGTLILGVPCVPYIIPLIRLKKFRGALASLHVNFFTRYTLRKSVEYAGWDVQEVRGFRFANPVVDYLFNAVYPHFYVVAKIDDEYEPSAKRLKELEGYKQT